MDRRSTERFTVAAAISVAGGLVALLAGRPAAALLAAPWVLLLALGLARARRRTIDVAVAVSEDRALVGDEIAVAATITGAEGVAVFRCGLDGGLGAIEPTAAAEVVVPDGGCIVVTLAADRWGTHRVGAVEVEVREPFGLFVWRTSAAVGHRVRVHPTPAELRRHIAPQLVRRIAGVHRSTASGRGVEYADLRPFAVGDSHRDINWHASARSPDLWVSQRHPDRATDVVLLLDSFVESGHDVRAVVGQAIEAAVGLAESHLAATDRVGVVELGGLVRWIAPATGRLQLQRLTDLLLATGLYANASERDLLMVPPRVLPPLSLVVALTPLLDPRFIDSLVTLAARGTDVAVIECMTAERDDLQGPGVGPTTASVARRIWDAERQVLRDDLAARGIAIASWSARDPFDGALLELERRRRRVRVKR